MAGDVMGLFRNRIKKRMLSLLGPWPWLARRLGLEDRLKTFVSGNDAIQEKLKQWVPSSASESKPDDTDGGEMEQEVPQEKTGGPDDEAATSGDSQERLMQRADAHLSPDESNTSDKRDDEVEREASQDDSAMPDDSQERMKQETASPPSPVVPSSPSPPPSPPPPPPPSSGFMENSRWFGRVLMVVGVVLGVPAGVSVLELNFNGQVNALILLLFFVALPFLTVLFSLYRLLPLKMFLSLCLAIPVGFILLDLNARGEPTPWVMFFVLLLFLLSLILIYFVIPGRGREKAPPPEHQLALPQGRQEVIWLALLSKPFRRAKEAVMVASINRRGKYWFVFQSQVFSVFFFGAALATASFIIYISCVHIVCGTTDPEGAAVIQSVLEVMALPLSHLSGLSPKPDYCSFGYIACEVDKARSWHWWGFVTMATLVYNIGPRLLLLLTTWFLFRWGVDSSFRSEPHYRNKPPNKSGEFAESTGPAESVESVKPAEVAGSAGSERHRTDNRRLGVPQQPLPKMQEWELAPVVDSAPPPSLLILWHTIPEFISQHAAEKYAPLRTVKRDEIERIGTEALGGGDGSESSDETVVQSVIILVNGRESPMAQMKDFMGQLSGFPGKFVLPLNWGDEVLQPVGSMHLDEWRRFCRTVSNDWSVLKEGNRQ